MVIGKRQVFHGEVTSYSPCGRGEKREEWCLRSLERLDVPAFGIRSVGLPGAEEDADPFEGQAAEGGVVAFADGALLSVEGVSPSGLEP